MDTTNSPRFTPKPWPAIIRIPAYVLSGFMSSFVNAGLTLCGDTDEEVAEKSHNDFNLDNLMKVAEDANDFLTEAIRLGLLSFDALADENDIDQAGNDFWLTRNGEDSGFWDRKEVFGEYGANALTELAKKFKETKLVVGENGQIYAEPLGRKPYLGLPIEYREKINSHYRRNNCIR